jgi:hypothetical protein
MNVPRLKHEASATVRVLARFVVLALVTLGISGTIYKVISPEGWIAQAFGRSASAGAAALGSLLMILGLAWFSRGWEQPRRRMQAASVMVYGFALAGFVYVAQLWLQGSL